ncbi:DUF4167 domain-containing protein [Jannaschia seohaensis]|uniref:Uncharacterized protein DUF4167 n=1 Tax=Jannaschia seohaensis TaxID=475081 RepID=A0A2Y9AB13_9RHOB|nr:DUF4167 domain-containing protein [Jannaschia seohaensis]PWJ21060.1 uncharacterized protein DUF4167 [Jannaschia seohaensis]SSA41470.1 protein of unknown function [Jannaschia seohaensis]
MRSSKSRSRNKNRNNRPQGGNIVNRVFDSSGPEGKVRGTPQQIIDKYNQLARDAQLSGDRVAVENFQQHAEHYTRMLAAAQKEIEARQQQQGGNQPGGQGQQSSGGSQTGRSDQASQGGEQGNRGESRNRRRDRSDRQQDTSQEVIDTGDRESGLVETPETAAESAPVEDTPPKPKRSRAKVKAEAPKAEDEAAAAAPAAEEKAEKPKRSRARRKAPVEEAEGKADTQPSEEV